MHRCSVWIASGKVAENSPAANVVQAARKRPVVRAPARAAKTVAVAGTTADATLSMTLITCGLANPPIRTTAYATKSAAETPTIVLNSGTEIAGAARPGLEMT